jgi:STE24 endopeptidase
VTPQAFAVVFVAALAASLAVRLGLAARQVAFVRAHRESVPAAFVSRIGIAAHRKAADYTVAKQRLSMLNAAVDALLLLALTLGGGLAWIVGWTGMLDIGPLWRDIVMFGIAGVIYGVVGLPFSWWHTFRIEERFGFNRMTMALWLSDLAKGLAVAIALGLPLLVLVLWLMRAAGA